MTDVEILQIPDEAFAELLVREYLNSVVGSAGETGLPSGFHPFPTGFVCGQHKWDRFFSTITNTRIFQCNNAGINVGGNSSQTINIIQLLIRAWAFYLTSLLMASRIYMKITFTTTTIQYLVVVGTINQCDKQLVGNHRFGCDSRLICGIRSDPGIVYF